MSVSVLTGGGGGIAQACAKRLAGRGPVLLGDVDERRLEDVAEALGGDVHTALCDVSDPASVAALAARAAELGALVHTAGLAPPTPHEPRRVLDVNLGGTKRVLDAFVEQATTGSVAVYAEQSALKRGGIADDVAGAVEFLTSSDAGYVTGCDLLVDGGVVAHTLDHAEPADRERWNRAGH